LSKPQYKQRGQQTHLMSVSVPEGSGTSSNVFEIYPQKFQTIMVADPERSHCGRSIRHERDLEVDAEDPAMF
jgi:hypothetical protein